LRTIVHNPGEAHVQKLHIVASAPDDRFAVRDIRQSGRVVAGAMDPRPILGADDRPAVGALGVLADNILGYALMASLPQGSWSISTEIWIDVVARGDAAGPVVGGEAEAVQDGSFAAGRLSDGAGRTVAQCRQRGRWVEPLESMPVGLRDPVLARTGTGTIDLGELLGVKHVDGGVALEATRSVLNPRQMLHGGVSLAASEFAATASRVDSGSTLPTSSVHIVHTRGVPQGATITFEPATRHGGRSLWVTDVLGRVEGKVCTVTTVTAQ
jgi:acyl-coenzyme A thioesterase PaaI-like protein